jgi:hypothetical protein
VQCRAGRCFKNPADNILIEGEVVNPTESYKAVVNDFIGRGGSGFEVLRRNTTKVNTGLSLRDALIDYMRQPPEAHGPGRICGSPFMVEPIARPTRPHRIFNKASSPGASCNDRPSGCAAPSGLFVDCEETGEQVRFFCVPFDFRDPTADPTDDCGQIAEVTTVFETASTCADSIGGECRGQLHCCEKPTPDGGLTAEFYCVAPLCVDPPPVGRIKRVVQ